MKLTSLDELTDYFFQPVFVFFCFSLAYVRNITYLFADEFKTLTPRWSAIIVPTVCSQ